MPIPNLGFLNRWAGQADAAIARTVRGSLNDMAKRNAARGAGPLTRHVAKTNPGLAFAMKGASKMGAMGARVGMAGLGLGITVGATAAVGLAGLAYGAGRVYNAALNAPMVQMDRPGGLPYLDRGGSLTTWAKHGRIPFTKRHLYSPMASRRMSDIIGAGAITSGIFGGVRDSARSRDYSVSQSLQNNTSIEVERPGMMGATGSLTLAMYNQRHSRPNRIEAHRMAIERSQREQAPVTTAATNMSQSEMLHALHMAHLAVGG